MKTLKKLTGILLILLATFIAVFIYITNIELTSYALLTTNWKEYLSIIILTFSADYLLTSS